MEENRLKPMPSNYDVDLFNELYAKTRKLTAKLSSEIDHRRFGVEKQDIMSWFDVKFIFAFNKYHESKPEYLLGYIINSLMMYKNRILRGAYTIKNSQHIMNIEDRMKFEKIVGVEEDIAFEPSQDYDYQRLMEFLKDTISDNAMNVLEIQLNPPPFICTRLMESGAKKITKIPNEIYAEYFELGISKNAIKYIEILKREIKYGIELAKVHFEKERLLNKGY